MPITRIGSGTAEATTITIPVGHQNGDFLVIWAFRTATTAPSLPTGWTTISSASAGASSHRCGWKLATSSADSSGTWTNATGLICHVYRGVSTVQLPATPTYSSNVTGTSATPNYNGINPLKNPGTSWIVAFGATKTTSATLETPPTDLVNVSNLVGAATEYSGHDSNGVYTAGQGKWPATTVNVGTSAEYRTVVFELLAGQGVNNNYNAVDVGDGMGTVEKIR